MKMVARCPACARVVDMGDVTCPHCSARLTKARFRPTVVLFYGIIGTLLAFILALVIVPVAILCALVALFAREKMHVVRFEGSDGDIEVD